MTSSDTGPAVAFDGVRKQFASGGRRITALDDLTLDIKQGIITGLVGPDAAGKTTLMRLCAGLMQPDEGRTTTLGLDVQKAPLAVQARVGYMPQQFGLYEDLTVAENLNLYADLRGVPPAARKDAFAELMEMTRLGDFTDRLAGRLSGGMKQKLGLACAMVRSPELLILDEPTAGVDPLSRRDLWRIIQRLTEDAGQTVLLSTAYLDEAEQCDDAVMLHNGRLLRQDAPAAVSGEQENRTWRVTASDMRKRRVQRKLNAAAEVRDAVIQGDGVRIVMQDDQPPDLAAMGFDEETASAEPVPPRFEDGYIALLSREKEEDALDADADAPAEPEQNEDADAPAIEVEEASRRFGDFYAVKQISFRVEKGEIFGLLGANGAGKTTTFRMICGLLPPSEGTLRTAGYDLRTAAAEARSNIGYMSQTFSLYGQLSVRQNLDFFSSAYNIKGKRKKDRMAWALDRFSLAAVGDAAAGGLPLGYKQRLALACTLMHEPDILFLDEPTSGVDPLARREFWMYINRLADKGVTVLITTHFMEEAEYCDRLVLLLAGEILARGRSDEIKAQAEDAGDGPVDTMEEAFVRLIENQNGAEDG